jgi:RNA polymerase sigma-70 factor (ECF subfamily)
LIAEEEKYRAWMVAALAGDGVAYRKLLAAVSDNLRLYYQRRLGPADAEDLVQETLAAIHSRRGTYDTSLPFTAWVYGIARYKIIDVYRRNKRRPTVSIDDVHELFANDEAEAANAKRDIEKLLAMLPDKQATLVRKIKLEGLSVEQVATRMGMSQSAVKVGVHRALKVLRGTMIK